MNIVMVSHYFESRRGGVEIVAGQLARAFTRHGHRVSWMASDSSPPPNDPAICERPVPLPANNLLERWTGLPYPVPLVGALARLRAEISGADVVLVHDGSYLVCQLALRFARQAGNPATIIQHIGLVPYTNPLLRFTMKTLNHMLTKPALAVAGQVVFISELTQQYFADVDFRRPPMIAFNGVDSSIFGLAPSGTDLRAMRRSLGLDPDRPTVLFVGRFVEKKGLRHLKQMAQCRPEWDWVLAGWGPIEPDRWRLPNVRIFSNRREASLAALYQIADALVLPSVGEGFPLVVQEALSCGLPVVCGEDTAMADHAAKPYLVGVRVHPADPLGTAEAFIGALTPIVEATEASDQLRRARAAFARERYNWATMAGCLLAAFASLRATSGDAIALPVSGAA
jgi:glycosyltransferase involved in cell wall biosynthesis